MKPIEAEHSKFIGTELKMSDGFRDLTDPAILTSGALGIYYCHTERLALDDGMFEEFGDSADDMINHAISMMRQHPSFDGVIERLANRTREILEERSESGDAWIVSGGQRRDWLFSGPVAHKLEILHASLYKQKQGQPDRIELFVPGENDIHPNSYLEGAKVVHIADLLTEGSSVYRIEDEDKGWIPMLRSKGAKVNDLITVVSRVQGGEERLAEKEIETHAFVKIDADYLRTHSTNPKRAVAYFENPEDWSRDYLVANGALKLVSYFDPNGKNIDRARKFLKRYGPTLVQARKYGELDSAVAGEYGKGLVEILK